MIYKLFRAEEWEAARGAAFFVGSDNDRRDGFIHFSSALQAPQTAALHFPADEELVLAEVDPARLGATVVWEPSRGGAMFPHLYAPLPLAAVGRTWVLPPARDGRRQFPAL